MTMPFIPQVRFEISSLDREADLFAYFLQGDRARWHNLLNRVYPELLPLVAEAKDEADAHAKCREFASKLHAWNKDEMERCLQNLPQEWDKISSDYLRALSEHFQTEWPTEHPTIVGYICVQPVFPRYLDTYSFCVGYKNMPQLIENSAHEILHFLWFKKWSEVFPEMGPETYGNSHLVWRLSEIIVQIILQCHPMLHELIHPTKWGYSSFAAIKVGDVSMTEYFKRVYEDAVAAHTDFADVMRVLWKEAQEHEAEISTF